MTENLDGPIAMAELMLRLGELTSGPGRRLLGIVGPPGSGKSTLAASLVETVSGQLGPHGAVAVSMDGFHLAQAELERLGRESRKGAPDTFDAAGFVALLRRLRLGAGSEDVYAPEYRRDLHNAVAGAVLIPAAVRLVIVEGNYLLLNRFGFEPVRTLLDETWYLEADQEVRITRLVERHMQHGKSADTAHAWAYGSDDRNAALVEASRGRADVVVRVT